jgi:hypothetical protein
MLLKLLPKLKTVPVDLVDIDFDKLEVFYIGKNNSYTSYNVDQDLRGKIKSCFPDWFFNEFPIGITIQKIQTGFSGYVHKDPRKYALNYLLELGGDNVTTHVFNSTTNEYETICADLHIWHLLKVSQNHYVDNMTSPRVSISLTFFMMPTKRQMDWILSNM